MHKSLLQICDLSGVMHCTCTRLLVLVYIHDKPLTKLKKDISCCNVQALTDALRSGQVGGVGLDVHWVEPADPEEQLYRLPNVLALPHAGTSTHEVFDMWATLLVENIVRIRDGRVADLLHRLV